MKTSLSNTGSGISYGLCLYCDVRMIYHPRTGGSMCPECGRKKPASPVVHIDFASLYPSILTLDNLFVSTYGGGQSSSTAVIPSQSKGRAWRQGQSSQIDGYFTRSNRTRQSIRRRVDSSGLRFGEMERDMLIVYSPSYLFHLWKSHLVGYLTRFESKKAPPSSQFKPQVPFSWDDLQKDLRRTRLQLACCGRNWLVLEYTRIPHPLSIEAPKFKKGQSPEKRRKTCEAIADALAGIKLDGGDDLTWLVSEADKILSNYTPKPIKFKAPAQQSSKNNVKDEEEKEKKTEGKNQDHDQDDAKEAKDSFAGVGDDDDYEQAIVDLVMQNKQAMIAIATRYQGIFDVLFKNIVMCARGTTWPLFKKELLQMSTLIGALFTVHEFDQQNIDVWWHAFAYCRRKYSKTPLGIGSKDFCKLLGFMHRHFRLLSHPIDLDFDMDCQLCMEQSKSKQHAYSYMKAEAWPAVLLIPRNFGVLMTQWRNDYVNAQQVGGTSTYMAEFVAFAKNRVSGMLVCDECLLPATILQVLSMHLIELGDM